jgi:hypothetical protein
MLRHFIRTTAAGFLLLVLLGTSALQAQSLDKTKLRDSYRKLNTLREVYAKATKGKGDTKGALRMRTRIDEVMHTLNDAIAGKASASALQKSAQSLLAEARRYNSDNARKTGTEARTVMTLAGSPTASAAKSTTKESSETETTEETEQTASTSDSGEESTTTTTDEAATTEEGTETVSDAPATTTPSTETASSNEGDVVVGEDQPASAGNLIMWLAGLFVVAIVLIGAFLLSAFRKSQNALYDEVAALRARLDAQESTPTDATTDPAFLKAEMNRRFEQLENNTLAFMQQLEQRMEHAEKGTKSEPKSATVMPELKVTDIKTEPKTEALGTTPFNRAVGAPASFSTASKPTIPVTEVNVDDTTPDATPEPSPVPAFAMAGTAPVLDKAQLQTRIHEAFAPARTAATVEPVKTIATTYAKPATMPVATAAYLTVGATPAPGVATLEAPEPKELAKEDTTDLSDTTPEVKAPAPVLSAAASSTALSCALEQLSQKTKLDKASQMIDSLLPGILAAEKAGKMDSGVDKGTFARLLQVAYLCSQRESLTSHYEDIKTAAKAHGFLVEDRMTGRQCYSDVYAENMTLEDYKVSARTRTIEFPDTDVVVKLIEGSPVMESAVKNTVLYTLRPTILLQQNGVKSVLQKGIYVVKA